MDLKNDSFRCLVVGACLLDLYILFLRIKISYPCIYIFYFMKLVNDFNSQKR